MRNPEAVAEHIREARSAAVCCHVNPDGDTIGSALALRLGLTRLGKTVEVFCADKVPDSMRGLCGAEAVRGFDSLREGERFDLLLPVDISDDYRMGKDAQGTDWFHVIRQRCGRTAQIDHHGSNPGYCEANDVDENAPAAGLLVREVLGLLGVPLDRDITCCLYTAISTDTGNFSYAADAETFRVMAELMEAGLPLQTMNRRLFVERPMAQQLLIARALASLRYTHGGELAVMRLTRADFQETGALSEHVDPIVNMGLQAAGAKMSLLGRESSTGIRMSLRALAPARVDGVARAFGGGGHGQAAGCTLQGALEESLGRVAAAMAAELDRQEQA